MDCKYFLSCFWTHHLIRLILVKHYISAFNFIWYLMFFIHVYYCIWSVKAYAVGSLCRYNYLSRKSHSVS
jgi:hypothetical protein